MLILVCRPTLCYDYNNEVGDNINIINNNYDVDNDDDGINYNVDDTTKSL